MPTTTITNQPNRHEYLGLPGQTDFTFDFQIFNGQNDLEVQVDGVDAAFNVALSGDEGGTIALVVPCSGGEVVSIQRVLEPERASQFPDAGPLARATLNHELNRLVGLIQDIQQNVDRATLMTDSQVIDLLEQTLQVGGSLQVQRIGDNIVLFGTMIEETVRDTVAAFLKAGAGILLQHDDALDSLTIVNNSGSGGGGLTVEETQDTVAAFLVAGAGISLSYNDVSNQLTITNTGAGYTDEQARDAVGAALVGANGITVAVDDAANTITISNSARVVQLPIMAGSFEPHPTVGPTPSTLTTPSHGVPLRVLDFNQSTSQYAFVAVPMPKGWNEGTITFEVLWTANGGAGDVMWGLESQAFSNDDTLDVGSFGGSPATVTDTLISPYDLHVTATPGPITPGGSAANEDIVIFKLSRVGGDASDTLNVPARLIGIRLKLTLSGDGDA